MRHATRFTALFIILLLAAAAAPVSAERATQEEMEQICLAWLDRAVDALGDWGGSTSPTIAGAQAITSGDTLLGMAFDIEPSGFVVVPVLKQMAPVKSYSTVTDLNMEDGGLPALIRDVLRDRITRYAETYGDLDARETDGSSERIFAPEQRLLWDRFLASAETDDAGGRIRKVNGFRGVGPLLTASWHQGAPYNNTCPMGDGGRTVVGCVATAAAQILHYHAWPPNGEGTHSYTWDGDQSCGGSVGGGTQYADFSDAYDWANMPDNCDGGCTAAQEAALAELCRETGVAFNMDYGFCGSGAYTSDALTVFPEYFRYDGVSIDEEDRFWHTADSWFAIIQEEIDANRPMQYRIEGHSIVCDGWRVIETTNQYHINYGWGGSQTAWYTIDNIYGSTNPMAESLIRGIQPAQESLAWTDATAAPLGDAGDGRGAAWADMDGDGDPDLYLTVDGGANRLFRNDGGGAFTDATTAPLGDTGNGRGAAWGDADNDGDPDLYLVNDGSANRLFRNDGDGAFTDATTAPLGDTGNGRSAAWGDYDLDGDLDLYLVNDGSANRLFRNDGASFVDVASGALASAGDNAAAWADADGDGDPDLYVATDGPNVYLRNDGGVFVDATSGALAGNAPTAALAWGDYDNDGDPDLFLANDGAADRLLRNDGSGVFTDATLSPLNDAGAGRAAAWVDHDKDGDLDLHLVRSGVADRLYRNDGGSWAETASGAIADAGLANGAAWADFDRDGDADLFLARDGADLLVRCDSPTHIDMAHRWVRVEPVGTVSNRTSIGARVRVVADGASQVRWIDGGSGALSQHEPVALFGLARESVIDSILVTWPSGVTQTLAGVPADDVYPVVELIAPSVTVLKPNGGEAWGQGSVQPIRWTNVHEPATEALVEYSVDAGASWDTVAVVAADTGYGEIAWTVPSQPTTQALVRVLSTNLAGADADTSNAFFTILPVPIVEVTSPNGGEFWEVGETRDVTWTNSGDPALSYSIFCSSDSGDSWFSVADSLAGDPGSHSWDVPDAPTYGALVRVVLHNAAGSGNDTSDALFKIAPASFASTAFTPLTAGPIGDAGAGRGVAWGDSDDDGDPDLYLVNADGANRLFRNDGGTLVDATPAPLGDDGNGLGAAWADADNDGDLDLYLAKAGANRLFRNDGGEWIDAASGPLANAAEGRGTAWADYNGDGLADLYLVNHDDGNKLFRNDGGGAFADVTGNLSVGGTRWGAQWADYDLDGDPDLYSVRTGSNILFKNLGNGSFTDVTSGPLGDTGLGHGAAWGDYDNDGDPDVYIANRGINRLLRNDGAGAFTDVTPALLADRGTSYGVAWADYDLDGDLDLFLANNDYNKLYRNDGGGTFANVANAALRDAGDGRGAAWADADADGDLDLYVANEGANVLFRNDLSGGDHWLRVRLRGTVSNGAAIGARVRAVAGELVQTRWIGGGGGYLSQDEPVASFGLGAATVVDTILVSWPSGNTQLLAGTAADTVLTLVEPSPGWADATLPPLDDAGVGQGIAWGDYDGDHDPDLYITNQSSANRLFRNDGGVFVDATPAPLADAGGGSGAAWGDTDNDGDLDLYIVNNDRANRLFRNDGGGDFADVTPALLADWGLGFSTAWTDFDGDGLLDLYLANAGSANKLFRNEGGGAFTDATTGPLGDIGFGFACAWADADNDGDPDLYLGNAFGANRMIRNDGGGAFTDVTAGPLGDASSTYGAAWGDYDNDGDPDLYITNEGATNRLFRNDGAMTFVDATAGALGGNGDCYGVAWTDFDLDADLDLFVVRPAGNLLLENLGDGGFADAADPTLREAGSGAGAALADADGDGDPDLYLPNPGGANMLLRNDQAGGNNWFRLVLAGTTSNAAAIGARVRLVAGGVAQTREVSGGSGYLSQDDGMLLFGLGGASIVDTLEILWPGGSPETFTTLAANQTSLIAEGGGSTAVDAPGAAPAAFRLFPNAPNPFNPRTVIRFEVPRRGAVRVDVYDITGRMVATLVEGTRDAGSFDAVWNGADARGRSVGSGVYFARMSAEGFTATRKMLLIR
ncbi:MAG: VCBS repeat-containing protein [Candidatus Eisenbacteria bacterium]|nr:VCBS repeat-containing protein [Candidatus Eisenbacteria bacterium]